ncbi:DsrE family protein [Chloroflexota bacterium]
MKIGIVIYSGDSEVIWNAFRFANSIPADDEVQIFLVAKGVECKSMDTETFNITQHIEQFVRSGGKVYICGTCLDLRKQEAPEDFSRATLKELYDIIEWCDKVISF